MSPQAWRIRGRVLPLDRPLVMGILNVTPDSFSDGGRFTEPDGALDHARRLEHDGADIIDIGGESTRPGATAIDAAEEKRRVIPVIQALNRESTIPISVDTRRADVAENAVRAGAHIVNDVSALTDPKMTSVVARSEAGLVLMHMQGEPATMQRAPTYHDVVEEVRTFLAQRIQVAIAGGVAKNRIAIDPGLGFGKRLGPPEDDNLTLLRNLGHLVNLGHPILVGASRKAFTGRFGPDILPVEERLAPSLAVAVMAIANGAHVIRAHDVKETRRAVDAAKKIATAKS